MQYTYMDSFSVFITFHFLLLQLIMLFILSFIIHHICYKYLQTRMHKKKYTFIAIAESFIII